jgi:hypothetical protein
LTRTSPCEDWSLSTLKEKLAKAVIPVDVREDIGLETRMKPEIRAAVVEWLSGLSIGATPLLAHAFLHAFVEPPANWADSWTGETLFVSITNSGMSVVTVYLKDVTDSPTKTAGSKILMVITLFVFLFSGMAYGVAAAGIAKDVMIWPAVCFLCLSAIASLYFVIATAK